MIPKIIHYCWFGGNPLPPLAKKCIKSWRKFCPDYEMKEWNEETFDISSAPLYVRQAYESKKWAFITDYVRLWAMYNFGGIYMDTDVEVVKPLDRFLTEPAFSGFESKESVPTGIMASIKQNDVIKDLLSYYDDRPFIINGEPDVTTNTEIITEYFMKAGLIFNNEYQTVNNFSFYPKDYFCPKSLLDGIVRKTENTYSIHHFDASWFPDDWKVDLKKRWKRKQKKARKVQRHAKIKSIIFKCGLEKLYNKIRKP